MLGKTTIKKIAFRLSVALLMVLPLFAGTAGIASAHGYRENSRVVYTMTNAAEGNAIQVYKRAEDGTLTAGGVFPTGGLGTGADLGSQGALATSADGRLLFAVNAGSNEISSFRVKGYHLTLVDTVSSDGPDPISLTAYGHLLYVLNAGSSGSITGFRVSSRGNLSHIAGSTQPLSNQGSGPAPSPEQISFNPNGKLLVVTEKGSNLIDIYPVHNGKAERPDVQMSAGPAPYGFGFTKTNVLVVSEAANSGTSSYKISRGQFEVISASIPDNQGAACWLTVTNNRKFVYVANAGTGNISAYQAKSNGKLVLIGDGVAGVTGDGTHPFDMGVSQGDQYLYVLNVGTNTISAFAIQGNGTLSFIKNIDAPAAASGLIAR